MSVRTRTRLSARPSGAPGPGRVLVVDVAHGLEADGHVVGEADPELLHQRQELDQVERIEAEVLHEARLGDHDVGLEPEAVAHGLRELGEPQDRSAHSGTNSPAVYRARHALRRSLPDDVLGSVPGASSTTACGRTPADSPATLAISSRMA